MILFQVLVPAGVESIIANVDAPCMFTPDCVEVIVGGIETGEKGPRFIRFRDGRAIVRNDNDNGVWRRAH